MSDNTQDLREEVRRLEKRLRWTQFISTAGLGLLLLLAILGATQTAVVDEVRARQFVLIGSDGVERAQLSTGAGIAWLALRDEKGRDRALLSVAPDGPSLSLAGKDLWIQAFVQVRDPGLPAFGLAARDGTPRAGLFVRATDNSSQLLLQGENDATRVELTAPGSRAGTLRLMGKDQKVFWKAP